MDVVEFCSDLIKCKSVTPQNDGAIEYIANFLDKLGFSVKMLPFSSGDNRVLNLFAKYSRGSGKKLGFLGHSDVVPPGDGWESNPFKPIVRDGYLIGRGVADMKGGISAFCCAAEQFIQNKFNGELLFFITGDEEIGSAEGIRSVIDWAQKNNEIPDDCILGEPSSDKQIGDRIYAGHRGSINVNVKSKGKQGHVAYPQNFKNSLMQLCEYITKVKHYSWEHNDKRFPETNLEPTLLFTGNYAENVVPGESSANLNIRFSGDYSSDQIKKILQDAAEEYDIGLSFRVSGEAYYCDDRNLQNLLATSIRSVTGLTPEFSAAGGTSDARHMIKHCNVIEFGLSDSTIHQANEKVKVDDLLILEKIYLEFLKNYFNA